MFPKGMCRTEIQVRCLGIFDLSKAFYGPKWTGLAAMGLSKCHDQFSHVHIKALSF